MMHVMKSWTVSAMRRFSLINAALELRKLMDWGISRVSVTASG